MCTSGSSIGSSLTDENGYFEIKAKNRGYSSLDLLGTVPPHLRSLFTDSGSFYIPWANPKEIKYIQLKRITNFKLNLRLENLRFDTIDFFLGYAGSNFSKYHKIPGSVQDTILNFKLFDGENKFGIQFHTKPRLKDSICVSYSDFYIKSYVDTLRMTLIKSNKDFTCHKRN